MGQRPLALSLSKDAPSSSARSVAARRSLHPCQQPMPFTTAPFAPTDPLWYVGPNLASPESPLLALLTHRRVAFLLCACLALYFGVGVVGNGIQGYNLNQEQRQLQRDIASLQEQHLLIQGLVEYMRSRDYVEYIARRDLGMVMPGEPSIVVISPEADRTAADTTATRWWQTLLGQ